MAQCTPVNTSNFSLFLSFVTGNRNFKIVRTFHSRTKRTRQGGKERRERRGEKSKKNQNSRRTGVMKTAESNADVQHVPRQLPLRQKPTLSLRSRGPSRSLSVQKTHGSLRLRIRAPLPVDRAKGGRNDRPATPFPWHGPASFRGLLVLRVREHYACFYLWVYLLRWQHLA